MVNLHILSNDDLKKRVLSLVNIDDYGNECKACGRPSLLHKGDPHKRTKKAFPDVILKILSFCA